MKEGFVEKADEGGVKVTINEVPVPVPGDRDVLIKVEAYGTNPKDWKYPVLTEGANSGDDVAGIVESVGKAVFEFKSGDRVAGMHVMRSPAGAFADYAVVPAHTTFHIPTSTSFEEASTVPLALLTAAFALFYELDLPGPWRKDIESSKSAPVLIYGASTAVGAFAIKLASLANLHPIIAIGSSNSNLVKPYLDESKGDVLVDYKAHKSPASIVDAIEEALTKAGVPEGRAFHGFDTISEPGTFDDIMSRALAGPPAQGTGQRPKLSVILPGKNYDAVDKSIDLSVTWVGKAHNEEGIKFATIWSALFSKGLFEGWLKPHPYEVMDGGLGGLAEGLNRLKNGEVRAKKLVGRPADTK